MSGSVWLWQGLSDSRLKCFSSDSNNCPDVGIGPLLVSPPTEGRSSATNTPVFPPSSFVLLSFAWFYIFFSAGQVLLSILSWFSSCSSVSEGVFLMYPWREMYSMSTCSVAIVFPPLMNFYIEGEKTSMKLKIQVKTHQPLLSGLMGYIWCFCNFRSMSAVDFCV